jgi:phage baseplate assembly protein V
MRMDIEEMVARLTLEVARLNRMISRQMRFGTVAEVDAAKGVARMMLSDPDGDRAFLGPWRPWAELAGATRSWRPPVPGQQMLVVAPGGDLAQSLLLPATFSNQFQAPSDKGDANRETLGAVTLDMEAERYGITAPHVDLGASGGKGVARIGDMVHVTFGSSAGMHPIIEGSTKVFASD